MHKDKMFIMLKKVRCQILLSIKIVFRAICTHMCE